MAHKAKMLHVDPCDMFKGDAASYSAFDALGVPTHDANGGCLSKNARKKLRKIWDKQKRLFDGSAASRPNI